MEIILKEDVDNLGYKDDVVKVKPGYRKKFPYYHKEKQFLQQLQQRRC